MTQPSLPASTSGPRLADSDRNTPAPFWDRDLAADAWTRFAVIGVTLLLFFLGVGSFELWDPWEVHYGEVGRQMVERGDWVSPWWGSHWDVPGEGAEGSYFYSKPVLLLWMMGMGLKAFGFSALGIRFGVALIASLGVIFTYQMGLRVFNRRVGVLMAGAMLTSPFYAMLGRQAQTDMPYVGLMTVALCAFMMGVFGSDRNRPVDGVSKLGYWTLVLGTVIPQLHTIVVAQLDWPTYDNLAERIYAWGWTQAGAYIAMLAISAIVLWRSKHKTRGQYYLMTFYVFVAYATMAKGILGFALPGAIIFLYLVVTREWYLLRRVELVAGVLTCLAVGFPWYGAMFALHGGINGAFWQRFIIHDHFKRLASGVHQIDTGSFEHFIRWLGYGLFPWCALLPFSLAQIFSPRGAKVRTDRDRARLFLALWMVIAFALFTLASTKFHHYVFPAVPPAAMLAALVVDDLWTGKIRGRQWWPVYIGGLAIVAVVGFDLIADPQNLKNLFSYKYDRRWDHELWDPPFRRALAIFVSSAVVGVVLLAGPILSRSTRSARKFAAFGATLLLINGFATVGWALNVYMPGITPTWSQGPVWQTYYDLCTPIEGPPGHNDMKRYCTEPAVSYKLNWRGETYYTQNEVLPIGTDQHWAHFLEQNGDSCFYAIMDRGRMGGFRNAVPAHLRNTIEEAHTSSLKFMLYRVNCLDAPPIPGSERAPDEEPDDGADAASE